MDLKNLKLGLTKERYYHKRKDKIGVILNCDFDDGATLIFESLDDYGDIMSEDIFICEASNLELCTKEIWERKYPVDEDNIKFWER